MANITISELRPAGFDLFQDSESFLNDLTDTDSMSVLGGSENGGGGGYNDSYLAYHAIVDIAVIHHLSFIAEQVASLASNVGGGNGGGGDSKM